MRNLNEKDVKLQVVSLNFSCPQSLSKQNNLDMVQGLLKEVSGALFPAANAYDVMKIFGRKEVSPFLMYRGPISIGDMLDIPVRVYKKVSGERLPTLKLYSDRLKDPDANHEVKREIEYKTLSNPDHPIPREEMVKAYKYGKQKVPLSTEEQESLSYTPDKGIWLMGFADKSQVRFLPTFGCSQGIVIECGSQC